MTLVGKELNIYRPGNRFENYTYLLSYILFLTENERKEMIILFFISVILISALKLCHTLLTAMF